MMNKDTLTGESAESAGETTMGLTKDQTCLLLYLETRAVDHAGRVDTRHMNADDMDQAAAWADRGFIEFGRICAADCNGGGTHWVVLSEHAWSAAHAARQESALRMRGKRDYVTTDEKRSRFDVKKA